MTTFRTIGSITVASVLLISGGATYWWQRLHQDQPRPQDEAIIMAAGLERQMGVGFSDQSLYTGLPLTQYITTHGADIVSTITGSLYRLDLVITPTLHVRVRVPLQIATTNVWTWVSPYTDLTYWRAQAQTVTIDPVTGVGPLQVYQYTYSTPFGTVVSASIHATIVSNQLVYVYTDVFNPSSSDAAMWSATNITGNSSTMHPYQSDGVTPWPDSLCGIASVQLLRTLTNYLYHVVTNSPAYNDTNTVGFYPSYSLNWLRFPGAYYSCALVGEEMRRWCGVPGGYLSYGFPAGYFDTNTIGMDIDAYMPGQTQPQIGSNIIGKTWWTNHIGPLGAMTYATNSMYFNTNVYNQFGKSASAMQASASGRYTLTIPAYTNLDTWFRATNAAVVGPLGAVDAQRLAFAALLTVPFTELGPGGLGAGFAQTDVLYGSEFVFIDDSTFVTNTTVYVAEIHRSFRMQNDVPTTNIPATITTYLFGGNASVPYYTGTNMYAPPPPYPQYHGAWKFESTDLVAAVANGGITSQLEAPSLQSGVYDGHGSPYFTSETLTPIMTYFDSCWVPPGRGPPFATYVCGWSAYYSYSDSQALYPILTYKWKFPDLTNSATFWP